MKININKIKPVPKHAPKSSDIVETITSDDLTLGVYGEPDSVIKNWIEHHGFSTYKEGSYTNIIIPSSIDFKNLFEDSMTFEYMDGFSPNLNKYLHIGHFSNLVLCKAFKGLGVCKNTVSIYGDTLQGEVSKESALQKLKEYYEHFNFSPDKVLFASEVKYSGNKLKPGTGKKEGTQVFNVNNNEIVGVKSDGSTSYFYQDVALAEILNAPTLYLTGSEQIPHFADLQQLFPHIKHIGLGLVKVDGLKMSSRLGNVIFVSEFIDEMNDIFLSDSNLIYNVFAGFILKSNPEADKNINIKTIDNPKNSAGLYISYTMARLNKAGCVLKAADAFKSLSLQFAFQKAKSALKPNILFEELVSHCKMLNSLYLTHRIQENPENQAMFNEKLADLVLGVKILGMFPVEYVGKAQEL